MHTMAKTQKEVSERKTKEKQKSSNQDLYFTRVIVCRKVFLSIVCPQLTSRVIFSRVFSRIYKTIERQYYQDDFFTVAGLLCRF